MHVNFLTLDTVQQCAVLFLVVITNSTFIFIRVLKIFVVVMATCPAGHTQSVYSILHAVLVSVEVRFKRFQTRQ